MPKRPSGRLPGGCNPGTDEEPVTKYIADVNKMGLKTVVVEASSEEEALGRLIQEWGENNIIIPPHLPESQEQLDSIESGW